MEVLMYDQLILVQVGFCPEASVHLQELKDMLIGISNELIDNITDLESDQIEKLRQERFGQLHSFFHTIYKI